MSIAEHDRTEIERQLMKAVRRGQLAFRRAYRAAVKLADSHPQIKDKLDEYEHLVKATTEELADLERIVGWELDPVNRVNEGEWMPGYIKDAELYDPYNRLKKDEDDE